MHLDYLYLCTVNEDKKFAPPRESFFSPTGEIRKASEGVRRTIGFDKEEGGRKWPAVRPEPLVLTMKTINSYGTESKG